MVRLVVVETGKEGGSLKALVLRWTGSKDDVTTKIRA